MDFREWLETKIDEDSNVGDLARDTFQTDWNGISISDLEWHLADNSVSSAVEAAFEDAVREFTVTGETPITAKELPTVIKALAEYVYQVKRSEDGERYRLTLTVSYTVDTHGESLVLDELDIRDMEGVHAFKKFLRELDDRLSDSWTPLSKIARQEMRWRNYLARKGG